jgi:hypothetical protein
MPTVKVIEHCSRKCVAYVIYLVTSLGRNVTKICISYFVNINFRTFQKYRVLPNGEHYYVQSLRRRVIIQKAGASMLH